MRGALMAGVVATSLHPANLVHIVKWTQNLFGALGSLVPVGSLYLHPCTLRILLNVRVSTSDGIAKDRGGSDGKGRVWT